MKTYWQLLAFLLSALTCGVALAQTQGDLITLMQRADSGQPQAQDELGTLFALGNKDVPRNFSAAAKWFRKAAIQGYAGSQYRLGTLYESGRGVAQSWTEARKWYSLAAKQGQVGAQLKLAGIYEDGRGVAQSFAEAAKWYRLAADTGNPAAQFKMGYLYGQGLGVPLNNEQAFNWYQKAAAQGNQQALQALIAMGAK